MKGMMRRFGGGMKTKTIHGVSTKHHDNPHVMRAHRASGGACAEGAGGAPSLSAPARRMGGKVMPQMQSKGDAKRVETGMPKRDGSDKAKGGECRASGGKVKENWPGYKGETKAGKAADGGMKLKSPGSQSGKIGMVEKGSSSKGKDDGMVKKGQGDGTTNQSGKKFAAGGATDKKDDGGKDDGDEDDDADSGDEADESAAKDIVKGADATAYGVRTEERRHGGHVKEGLYDDAHHDDEYAKGGKAKKR